METQEYLELIEEIKAAYSRDRLRQSFIDHNPTTDALFRRLAVARRRDCINAQPHIQVWLGYELATNSPMLRQYDWYKV